MSTGKAAAGSAPAHSPPPSFLLDTDPLMGLPTAKKTLETGTTLPQLLAERKSVRWDEEEERDEAREPR